MHYSNANFELSEWRIQSPFRVTRISRMHPYFARKTKVDITQVKWVIPSSHFDIHLPRERMGMEEIIINIPAQPGTFQYNTAHFTQLISTGVKDGQFTMCVSAHV